MERSEEIKRMVSICKENLNAVCYFVDGKLVSISHNKVLRPNKINKKQKVCCVCGFKRFVELHHIVPKVGRRIALCPNHHRLVHHNLLSSKEKKRYLEEVEYFEKKG